MSPQVVGSLDVPEILTAGNPQAGSERFIADPTDARNRLFTKNSAGVLVPAGYGNPMTASGDLIVGGSNGTAARLPKGAANTVLGVDGSGVLGYQVPQPASIRQLNYTYSGTLNGLSLSVGANTLVTLPSFSVSQATSQVAINVNLAASVQATGGLGYAYYFQIVVDGTPWRLGAGLTPVNTQAWPTPSSGTIWLSNLAVGTHTLAVQVVMSSAGSVLLRPGSADYEFLYVQVEEIAAGGPTGPAGVPGAPITRLNYVGGDLFSGAGFNANTPVPIVANQSFTVSSPQSLVQISVSGACQLSIPASGGYCSVRLVVDNGTPFSIGGEQGSQGSYSQYINPFSGCGDVWLTGLAAGTHTVRAEFYSNVVINAIYLQAATSPQFYGFRLSAIEFSTSASTWVYRGAWNATTVYQPNDVVTQGGSSYLAMSATTNQTPASNPAVWAIVAAQGATGPAGTAPPSASTRLLDYTLATDSVGITVNAGQTIDITPAQSFSVARADSIVGITISGSAGAGGGSGTLGYAVITQAVIDGVAAPLGGETLQGVVDQNVNPFAGAGTIWRTGLAIGSHTVKVTLTNTSPAAVTFYLVPSGGKSYCKIQVVEVASGGLPGPSGGPASTKRLSYVAPPGGPDLQATSMTAGQTLDVIANQSFTVGEAGSLVCVTVNGEAQLGPSSGYGVTYVTVDGTDYKIGMFVEPTAQYINPFAGGGTVWISGLSVGTHTVKVRVYSQAAASFYLRQFSQPAIEGLSVDVVEVAVGGPAGLTWRGPWSAATAYVLRDGVTRNGSAYIARQASTGSDPALNPADWDILVQAGSMTNPMSVSGDLIVGGTGGVPARLPKGGNGTILGVDTSGNVGYQTPTPASFKRLEYLPVGNLYFAFAATANTVYDLGSEQSFSVGQAGSVVMISLLGCMLVTGGTGAVAFGCRVQLLIDNTTTVPIGEELLQAAGSYFNPFSGSSPISLTNLAVGTHTVKIQLRPGAAMTLEYRQANDPIVYFCRLTVTEIAAGGPQGLPGVPGAPIVRVNYTGGATDLMAGTTLPAGTWVNVCADQPFVVSSPQSLIKINVSGSAQAQLPTAASICNIGLIVDGQTTPTTIGSETSPNAAGSQYVNPFSGCGDIWLTGLAAGSHTVRVAMKGIAAGTVYLQQATQPQYYAFRLTAVEFSTSVSSWTYRGTWDAGIAYQPNDVVTRSGSSYLAIQPTVGAAPESNPSIWAVVAAQGSQGTPGTPGTPASIRQLNYIDNTNKWVAASVGSGTYDLFGDQNFNVSQSGSVIEISINAVMQIQAAQVATCGALLVIDGDVANPIKIGGGSTGTTPPVNPFMGNSTVSLTGLAVGTHTVRVRVWWNAATVTATYSPPTNNFTSYCNLQVVEIAAGGPQGVQGVQGVQGPQGPQGPQGVPGTPGTPASVKRLDYSVSTDVWSGFTSGVNNLDIFPNQSFTIGDAASVVEVSAIGSIQWANSTAGASAGIGVYIDNVFNQWIARTFLNVANQSANPFAGASTLYLTGLSPGTHTIRLIISMANAGNTLALRAASVPHLEFCRVQIVEVAVGGPPGAAGAAPIQRLNYNQTTDVWSATALSAGASNIFADQAFTVASAQSLIRIDLVGCGQFSATGAGVEHAVQVVVDGTVYPMGGETCQAANQFLNPFSGSGSLWLTGLSAGSHMIRARVWMGTAGTAYLRPVSSAPQDFCRLTVTEFSTSISSWTYRGIWDAGVAYQPNDVVTRSGSSYLAIQSTVGAVPESNPSIWAVVASATGPPTTTTALQLNATSTGDVSALAVPANTWTPVRAASSFNVTQAGSLICISVVGTVIVVGSGAQTDLRIGSSLVVDNTTRYRLGGSINHSASEINNALSGAGLVTITGLSVGSHTVRLDVIADQSALAYNRVATLPNFESLLIQVDEIAVGGPYGLTFQGAWSSATSYAIRDAVQSGGSLWIANQAGVNHDPATSPAFWDLLLAPGSMTNPMTSPNDLIVGSTLGAPARLGKGANGQVLGVNPSGNVAYLNQPAVTRCLAHTSAAQSIPWGAVTPVAFNVEDEKVGVTHDNASANHAFTMQVAGLYSIMAFVAFTPNAVGERWLTTSAGPYIILPAAGGGGNAPGIALNWIGRLGVGSGFYISVYQNRESSLALNLTSASIAIVRIGD
jgi:hypothetical protein